MAASGMGDIAFRYILEVETPGIRGENFAFVAPEWVSLEGKLSVAIQERLSGPMRQEIQRIADEQRRHGRSVSGRWKLWIVHRRFMREAHLRGVHAYNDLSSVKYSAKKGYAVFYHDWTTQLSINGDVQVDPVAQFALFLPEVEKMSEMAFDLEVYNRMPPGDPNKTYEWLLYQMENHIERDRIKEQTKAMDVGLKKLALPATDGDGDGDGGAASRAAAALLNPASSADCAAMLAAQKAAEEAKAESERATRALEAANALLGRLSRRSTAANSRNRTPPKSPRTTRSPGGGKRTPGGGRISPGGRRYSKSPGRTPIGSGRASPKGFKLPADLEKIALELGLCFNFLKGKCACKTGSEVAGGECKYKHERPPGFKTPPRSPGRSGESTPSGKKRCTRGAECKFLKTGKCRFWHPRAHVSLAMT